jgi:hypothetical protein
MPESPANSLNFCVHLFLQPVLESCDVLRDTPAETRGGSLLAKVQGLRLSIYVAGLIDSDVCIMWAVVSGLTQHAIVNVCKPESPTNLQVLHRSITFLHCRLGLRALLCCLCVPCRRPFIRTVTIMIQLLVSCRELSTPFSKASTRCQGARVW